MKKILISVLFILISTYVVIVSIMAIIPVLLFGYDITKLRAFNKPVHWYNKKFHKSNNDRTWNM